MKNVTIYIIIGLSTLLAYLTYLHTPPEYNDPEYLFWGRLNIILNALPAIIYFNGSSKKNSFPFIAFVGFFQMLAFGLPVFFIRIDTFQMNKILNLDAIEAGFWGMLIFYSTYFLLYKHIFQRLKPFASIPKVTSPFYINTLVIIVLLVYLSFTILKLDAIQHLGFFSLFVYLGLTITKILRKRANPVEIFIFVIVLGFEIVERVTSGLIAAVANLIIFLSLVLILEGSKKYLIAAFIIPFFIFYSAFSGVKGKYREIAWFGKKELSYEQRVDLIADLIEKNEKNVKFDDKEGQDNLLWRFSYPMSALSLVMTKTPSAIPYWNGDTYLPIFSKFIPRTLWLDKPEENMGQRFGKTYRIIRQRDNATSINTPILAELYMNFGFTGFYIGMFVLGLLFIFLDKFFNSSSVSHYNQIINMSIIFPLMIMESNFSLVYGNLFLICISLFVIFRSIKSRT